MSLCIKALGEILELVLLKVFRPITCPVNYSKYLDLFGDNPVWDNKRRIGYNQLAGTGDPARPADLKRHKGRILNINIFFS